MIFLRVLTGRLLLLTAIFAAIALAAVCWIPLGRYRAQFRAVLQPFLPPPPTQTITPAHFPQFAAAPAARLRVRGCFASDFDPNWSTDEGRTPLTVALLTQDAARLKTSINGETVNHAEVNGRTPLMIAAGNGNSSAIQLLIAGGANPNLADREGRTALQYAISANHFSIVAALLPLTAEPVLRNALLAAYETADWPLIEALAQRLAPANEWSAGAVRLLQRALADGDDPHSGLLLAKHTPVPTQPGRKTPLIAQFVATGDLHSLQTMLRCGADVNTVVPFPAEKAFLESLNGARYLRDYVEGDSGITLLMLAAGAGREEIVRALLQAGAERNRMTAKYKMMALYFAARSKNYRCTQLLLGSGPAPEDLHIEVNLAQQRAAVLKGGVAILTSACSTGRDGFGTPPGTYVITDKDRNHRSTIYKVPMPYFMRLNCRDFGMHEGVVSSPHASHGCIRLPGDTARRLFSEIPVGTVVQIN